MNDWAEKEFSEFRAEHPWIGYVDIDSMLRSYFFAGMAQGMQRAVDMLAEPKADNVERGPW